MPVYTGLLSTSFTLMGRLCLDVSLSGSMDSGLINGQLEGLHGKRVRITVEEF